MKKFALSALFFILGCSAVLAQAGTGSSGETAPSSQAGVRSYSSSYAAKQTYPTNNQSSQTVRVQPGSYYRGSGGMMIRQPSAYYQRGGAVTAPGTVPGSIQHSGGMSLQSTSSFQYQRGAAAVGAMPGVAPGVMPGVASGVRASSSTTHSVQTYASQQVKGASVTATVKGQDANQSITSNGLRRTFLLHLPAGFSKSKAYPIVFVLHGLKMDGHMMYMMSNMSYWADQMEFIAVYPDGLGQQWETSGGDFLFIHDMVKHISTLANVDQRRIYAAGISNGGHFVQALACQSDDIAAIAVVAATKVGANCGSNRSIPVILILGTEDPVVPMSDPGHKEELGKLGEVLGMSKFGSMSSGVARLGGFMTAEETIDFWVQHNGCSVQPYSTDLPDTDPKDGTRVTRMIYGSGSNEVDYYKVYAGGHSWPGSVFATVGARDILGRTSLDIDASRLIAEFFMRH